MSACIFIKISEIFSFISFKYLPEVFIYAICNFSIGSRLKHFIIAIFIFLSTKKYVFSIFILIYNIFAIQIILLTVYVCKHVCVYSFDFGFQWRNQIILPTKSERGFF